MTPEWNARRAIRMLGVVLLAGLVFVAVTADAGGTGGKARIILGRRFDPHAGLQLRTRRAEAESRP